MSRNDTAHPRSSWPSSAALIKTKSPLQGNPIQILFARLEKVRKPNPPEDLKFWLACATPEDSSPGARRRAWWGHAPPSLLLCADSPQLPPEHRHYRSHVTTGRSRAQPSLVSHLENPDNTRAALTVPAAEWTDHLQSQ